MRLVSSTQNSRTVRQVWAAPKVSSEIRGNIESALSNLEDKLKGDDKEPIEAVLKQLNAASMELGKAVYKATAAEQAKAGAATRAGDAGDTPDSNSGGDDVIDAEYEVKEDK